MRRPALTTSVGWCRHGVGAHGEHEDVEGCAVEDRRRDLLFREQVWGGIDRLQDRRDLHGFYCPISHEQCWFVTAECLGGRMLF
jgi:hypothetical protein